MGMSSTCVLLYAMPSFQGCMPCIFVISVVTSTSMQSLLLFCCHVNLMLQRNPCIFWRCSVRMFCSYSCNGSIPAIVCNYGVPYHDSILLYFGYKISLLNISKICMDLSVASSLHGNKITADKDLEKSPSP